eukprot:sb/3474316/
MTGDDGREDQTSPTTIQDTVAIPDNSNTAAAAPSQNSSPSQDTAAPSQDSAAPSQECYNSEDEVTVVVTLKHVTEVPENVTDIQVLELDSKSPYIQRGGSTGFLGCFLRYTLYESAGKGGSIRTGVIDVVHTVWPQFGG